MTRGSAATALRLAPISLQGRAAGEARLISELRHAIQEDGHPCAGCRHVVRARPGEASSETCRAAVNTQFPFTRYPRPPAASHVAKRLADARRLLKRLRSHGFVGVGRASVRRCGETVPMAFGRAPAVGPRLRRRWWHASD